MAPDKTNQPKSTPLKKERLSTKVRKGMFLEALTKTLGVKTPALKMAGIVDHNTIDRWRDKDPKFAKEMDAIAEQSLDFAETALYKKIKDGDTTAIIFYLKTKGKKRGYTERTEITGANGKNLFANKTDEELDAIIADLKRKLE